MPLHRGLPYQAQEWGQPAQSGPWNCGLNPSSFKLFQTYVVAANVNRTLCKNDI